MFRLSSLHAVAARLLPPALGDLGEAPGVGLGRFPACFNWLGVEARLADADADADDLDLALSLDPAPLARLALLAALPGLAAELPGAWSSTLDRLAAWARADAGLARAPAIWLEVDRGREATPPILFVTTLGLAASEVEALVDRVVDGPRAPALVAAVRRLVAAWSGRGAIHHLADLRPRGVDAVRVVGSVGRGELDRLLGALAWAPERGALTELGRALGELADPWTIDVDVAIGGRGRLGVECHLPTDPAVDRRWRPIFDHAVRAAGATPARLAALHGWPTRHVLGDSIVIDRHLHLKFTLREGAAPTSKAYLGVRPTLTSR